jgi:phospholipase/carboxylesterase
MTISRGDDLPLRYVLNVPSGKPATAEMPLVVLMHGRGADANDLADIAPMIDSGDGYRFLFPNAPRPWEMGAGQTFGFTWFDGWPPEPSSFADSRARVFEFLAAAVEKFPTPEDKVIISGFSQGALMALHVAFNTDVKIAGVVAMSGALHEADMGDLAARKDLPVLIVHGVDDDVIPVLAAHRARRVLESHGLQPEYHEFRMGHFVTPESMAVVADFLRRCLAP